MNIYQKIKTKNKEEIKVLGTKAYTKVNDKNITKCKFLFGLFKSKQQNNKMKYYILGIRIFSGNKKQQTDINQLIKSLMSETKSMLSVYNLHSKVFPQFKQKHLNKNVCIVGCGPTLRFYKQRAGFIHIGLNKAYKKSDIIYDYLFFVDIAHKGNSLSEIEKINCIKFLGLHCNPEFSYCNPDILYNDNNTSFCLIPEIYAIKNNAYRFYSNAHRNEIFYDIETSPLMDFGSVAFPAIHFALYTHPKKIFLIGCDCSNNGYFNDEKQPVWNDFMLNRTFYGYKKLKKFAKVYYPDVEIISVNPVGLKGLFRDVYTKSWVEAHPELLDGNEIIEYLEDEDMEDNVCV